MLSASLYITLCTAKNRARVRLRRLREPRYLLGAVVGTAYFYFTFFARSRSSRAAAARRAASGRPAFPPQLASLAAAVPAFAALGLLIGTAITWLVPGNSGLVEFSDAEVHFLFPAPVTRRQLLLHRMVRSQIGLLFASAIVAIATPSAMGLSRLRVSIAMWVLLVTAKVHYAGVTLARSRLTSSHKGARRVAWLPVLVITAALAVVIASIARAAADPPPPDAIAAIRQIGAALLRSPSAIILWPFSILARPLFAEWPQPYLWSLSAALLVLAAVVVWVLQSDLAFHEAAAAAVERRASEPAAKRAGYRVRGAGWMLRAHGRPELAFGWKAATQTFRVVDRMVLLRAVIILFSLTIVATSMSRARGFAAVIGMFATMGAGVAVLLVPQALRIDMRQDLQHLELLKTWPVPAPMVVRGEMIWPGTVVTAAVWLMLTIAAVSSASVFPRVPQLLRVSTALAAGVMAPAMVFAQFTIHNGVALMFPAWVPLGGQRPRGLDAMGQRLIILGGTWLMLIVMTLPGLLPAVLVWFALTRVVGAAALVPAAVVCAAIVGVEVLLATEALGPAYERLDLTQVERAE